VTVGDVMRRARREALWESWRLRGEIAQPRPGWHRQVACSGTEACLEACESCPVRLDCLAAAIAEEAYTPIAYRHGWRGIPATYRTTPQVMRLETVAICGTDSGYFRHLRTTKTEPCDACRAAHAEANRVKNRDAGRSNNHRKVSAA
jgi:hypothetical protein